MIECDHCGEHAVFETRRIQEAKQEMKWHGWRLGKSLHEDYCIECVETLRLKEK